VRAQCVADGLHVHVVPPVRWVGAFKERRCVISSPIATDTISPTHSAVDTTATTTMSASTPTTLVPTANRARALGAWVHKWTSAGLQGSFAAAAQVGSSDSRSTIGCAVGLGQRGPVCRGCWEPRLRCSPCSVSARTLVWNGPLVVEVNGCWLLDRVRGSSADRAVSKARAVVSLRAGSRHGLTHAPRGLS
jgi:hypothetical protein